MPPQRPTPFALVFGSMAPERFPALQRGIAAAGRDPRDRDGFLLVREVAELLQDLRPEAGMGEAVAALVALLHHAYLFWMDGEHVDAISEEQLAGMLSDGGTDGLLDRNVHPPTHRPTVQPSIYVQLPHLRVWGTPLAGGPPEPLDGWFARQRDGELDLLAIFGMSPAREGLSAVELSGPRPVGLARSDGSALFAPTLTGGVAAGLASVTGEAELLELAWRAGSR
jgi:hypothetical protein